MSVYTGSFYFLGTARPAYFEATTLKGLRERMFKAINQMSMDDWQFFAFRIDAVTKEIRKKGCSGASAESGTKGVSVYKRKHDTALDDIVADFPAFPGLDYSLAINA